MSHTQIQLDDLRAYAFQCDATGNHEEATRARVEINKAIYGRAVKTVPITDHKFKGALSC